MNKRRPLIAGNWKLHCTLTESRTLAREIRQAAEEAPVAELVVAPVFTALATVADVLQGSPIGVSAQDVYPEPSGAFTGEVSAPLLRDAGCSYGIVGHSERRQLFGETDEHVRQKAQALLTAGLKPILCVGETLAQRESGATLETVLGQVEAGTLGMDEAALTSLAVAYEPIWAIGTGRTASPEDAQAVHAAIREALAKQSGPDCARRLRILYGGSVKPDNAGALLRQPDVDGALVGGASLRADSFMAIARALG